MLHAVGEKKRLLNKHVRTSCFQRSVFPFCVTEFQRQIHNCESVRLKYFVVPAFFVRGYSCSAIMQAGYSHPQFPFSSFILPIDCAGGTV